MKEAPKEGEPNKKVVKDKPYWWCPKHGAWGRHKPSECEGKGINPKGTQRKPQDNKAHRLSKALAAVVEDDADDDE